MFESREASELLPPYHAFDTFKTFFQGLGGVVPERIDRSVMEGIREWERYQVASGIRYLGTIDAQGIPQPSFYTLATAKTDAEWKKALRAVLEPGYPFIFGSEANGFSLATGTSEQLAERFRSRGMSGDTIRKSAAFLLNAARDAGMAVSPDLKASRVTAKKDGPKHEGKVGSDLSTHTPVSGTVHAQNTNSHAQTHLPSLPEYEASWPSEVKKIWFELLHHREVGDAK